MAAIPVTDLSPEQRDELLCVYSCLILHDDEAEISAANINKLVEAAGTKVEPYWGGLFEKLLAGKDVSEMLMSTGGGGGAAPAAGGAAGGDAGEAGGKEEKKVEEEEEEEEMDFDLFG